MQQASEGRKPETYFKSYLLLSKVSDGRFLFGVVKCSKVYSDDDCTTLWLYHKPLNYVIQNGEFYVMWISKFKNFKKVYSNPNLNACLPTYVCMCICTYVGTCLTTDQFI